MLDAEHGARGYEPCLNMVRACDAAGMVTVVRVPENNPAIILGYLEVGVLGIMAPHVNTAADAQAIVDAVKYGPQGKRGAGES